MFKVFIGTDSLPFDYRLRLKLPRCICEKLWNKGITLWKKVTLFKQNYMRIQNTNTRSSSQFVDMNIVRELLLKITYCQFRPTNALTLFSSFLLAKYNNKWIYKHFFLVKCRDHFKKSILELLMFQTMCISFTTEH